MTAAAVDVVGTGAAREPVLVRAPDQGVVPRAAEHHIVAPTPKQVVITGAPVDRIVAPATIEDVAAGGSRNRAMRVIYRNIARRESKGHILRAIPGHQRCDELPCGGAVAIR